MDKARKNRPVSPARLLPRQAKRFAHHAMATVFEVVIVHDDARYAEQCAHEAFSTVDRLEQSLSRFITNSDVSRINRAPVGEAVRVGIDAIDCLHDCVRLHGETGGACDVGIGALSDYWSKREIEHQPASPEQLADLRERAGIRFLELDRRMHTVTRRSEHVSVDLGGYGKGYAVDRMAEVLGDWDIDTALLHGGASSVLALAPPPGEPGWRVSLRDPGGDDALIDILHLRHIAVSGSGLRKGHHIIDPRTASPAAATRAAWSFTRKAAAGDALSTAFMVMSADEIRAYRRKHPDDRALVIPAGSADGGGGSGRSEPLRFGDLEDLAAS